MSESLINSMLETLQAAEERLDAKAAAFKQDVAEITDFVFDTLRAMPLHKRAELLATNHQNPVFIRHGNAQRFANESLQVSREIRAYDSHLVNSLREAIERNCLPGSYFLYLYRLATENEDEDDKLVLVHDLKKYLTRTQMRLPQEISAFLNQNSRLVKIALFF